MIRWRWIWFSFAILIFAFAFPASNRLNLDRSLQKMFASNDPIRKDFEFLQTNFGVAELVVFAYRDADLWRADAGGLERLLAIRTKIESVHGVATAMDLSKIDQMLGKMSNPLSVFKFPGSAKQHPLLDQKDTVAQKFKILFEGQTHSSTSDLVAIACLLQPEQTSVSISKTIASLREIGATLPNAHGVPEAMLVGQPVMVEDGFEAIESDGLRLGVFSSISLTLLLLIGFRSLRWALITVAIVQWSLVVTRALLVWMAWDLTMVSSMLSSIVTVIGVATTMHWLLGYQNAMRDGLEPKSALSSSMQHLWRPIMWACITDAIGFASLSFAKVGPVQDYGSMMALASLVVLVGIFSILPALALLPLGDGIGVRILGMSLKLADVPGDAPLRRVLTEVLSFALKRPLFIVVCSSLLGLVAVWGTLRLRVETDFIKNFESDAPLVVAYQAIEKDLGGAGVWDVIVPAPNILTQEYLELVLELEAKLRDIRIPNRSGNPDEELQLSLVMSFADADLVSQDSPVLAMAPVETRLLGMRNIMGAFADTLITNPSSGTRLLRIMLRSQEQSEAEQKEELIRLVRQVVADSVASEAWGQNLGYSKNGSDTASGPAFVVTGYYVLLSELVRSVIADQWRCFAIATIGIWFAMAYALRSPLLATLAILPNALPSLCILGFMGWMEMRVNLGAAMIAAVSMGLSVDSSLHYLMRYQRAKELGITTADALVAAQSEIGMALGLSTCALVVGFSSLASSSFLPTVVFGTTASISMVGGLLGNLIQLPALVRLFDRPFSWNAKR